MREVLCAILDLDGTLVDSNEAHAWAWWEALRRSGFEVPYLNVRSCIGMGADELIPSLIGLTSQSMEGAAVKTMHRVLFLHRAVEHIRPFPYAYELVARMRADGLRPVVASSASGDELAAVLRVTGLHRVLPFATTSSEVERSKPEPDVVAAALERADCPPDRAIVLGDTPYDLASARAAGVGFVGVRTGGWNFRWARGVLGIYDSVEHLFHEYGDSPFAASRRARFGEQRPAP